MVDFTRRGFLTQMSVTTGVGIAGGLGLHKLLAPGTSPQIAAAAAAAPAQPPSPAPAQPNPAPTQQQALQQQAALNLGGITLAGPMLLHVRDVPTGEVSMMVGTRELIYRDPELVSRLVDKARSAEG